MNCDCWFKKSKELEAKAGFKLADVCTMFTVTDELGLHATHGIPLERADGKKLKRDDARMLQMSFCPFCGEKYL